MPGPSSCLSSRNISLSTLTAQPSAICSTGPSPFTRFRRHMVTGMSPLVRNLDVNPPPRMYSLPAGCHVVAFRQASTSFCVSSQNGFIAGTPSYSAAPVASRVEEPEFIRCIIPFAALPSRRFPVTRSTASGLQYVRISENSCPFR